MKSLWWYAHSAIQRRHSEFNKTMQDSNLQEMQNWTVGDFALDMDQRIARLENHQCDSDLRDHFIEI